MQSFESASEEALAFFAEHGWLALRGVLPVSPDTLSDWVDEVAAWADGGPGLHYREATEAGPKLCRSENFTPSHAGLYSLLREGSIPEITSALLGEPAVLYKEKINYKLSGGAGYSPHQDAPAYRFIERHISCMLAVDAATPENGCLEVVSGRQQEILPQDERGCISAEVVAEMDWETASLEPGDVLWFHSRTPHRSAGNSSSKDRRALYPTYNALSEGDLRDAYYEQKLAEFAASADDPGRIKLSLIGDFEGKAL
ncbi:MAG: phytanoyl-CoA dioxygenase family protein [Actinobacteria bacterium]|nr:phytanoyl-CoA dioxygenase family protein [Actinomycetota bacterium]